MPNLCASKEWLHQKYIVEDMGTPAIAKVAGCDGKTVYYWLRKHGIPTRPRGVLSAISKAVAFQPGQRSLRALPVGSRTIRDDKNGTPRRWIKIEEPNKWIPNAQYVWEAHHGPIPEGHIIHHIDGDSLNDVVGNFDLVTRTEHALLHFEDLRAARPSLTHEKLKTCPDCNETWTGRGRAIARCDACKKMAHARFNAVYRSRRAQRHVQ